MLARLLEVKPCLLASSGWSSAHLGRLPPPPASSLRIDASKAALATIAAYRRIVESLGSLDADSSRATYDCDVPIRRATSDCVSPRRSRSVASRLISRRESIACRRSSTLVTLVERSADCAPCAWYI